MTDGGLDPGLAQFIRRAIPSVWALEVLLLVRIDPGRTWTVAQLTAELRSSSAAMIDAVAGLARSGLLQTEDGLISYRAATRELDGQVRQLAEAYARTPIAIIKTVLSGPDDKLRIFADAFKLKRD